jgi:hypothetical protein
MFNKNDPLIGAVTKIMEQNEFRREVEKKLCEELGIYSRNALPNEHLANYDALLEQRMKEGLHPNQQKLDVHEPEKDKLTKHDFKMLRAGKKAVSEEEKIDEVLDTKEKKEKYTKAATKSLKDSFGKKDKDSAHTVSKRIYGLSKIKEEMQDSKNPLPPASAKERIQNKLGTGPKSSVDPSYKHQGATASDREEMNKKMEKLDEVSKDTLKKALPGLEKRRFTAKDPGKADQAFKMAKAKLGMPVGSNAGGGKRIPVYMTPKVMAKEEQQLDEKMSDDDKASVALRKVVAKHKLKDAAKETRPGYVKKQSQEWYNKMTKRANAKVEEEVELDEAAKSKSQHRFFGLVRAIQKGKAEGSEKAEKAAKEMSVKSVRDYAKTKEKGLPEKVKKMDENLSIENIMNEIESNIGSEIVENALSEIVNVNPRPGVQRQVTTSSVRTPVVTPRPVAPSGPVSRPGDMSQRPAPVSTRPVAPAPATTPVATPRPVAPSVPVSRPDSTSQRPVAPVTATTNAPETQSKQMFQSYSDKGDDASSADFARADRQMQKERPLRESLEHVIRKMHENE